MSCIINASTTSGLVMTSDLSGVLQLQNNGVAVPPLTVAPAFSAYLSTAQNITTSTWTKIAFNTKEYDTASAFDATTNYRFTPLVAGYYQINLYMTPNGTSITQTQTAIYKNGSLYRRQVYASSAVEVGGSSLVYLNGSTDYLEFYGFVNATSPGFYTEGNSKYTYVDAFLARSA